jgi:predicted Fe-Mo cluster-binding NifX family protein
MRYAVPINNSKLADHFGYCEYFALIDADESKKVIKRKEIIASPGHQPGLLPVWLAEQGVSAVIAVGMGSRAQGLFRESRIEVITGTLEDDPEKAVLDYIEGKLAIGENICDH